MRWEEELAQQKLKFAQAQHRSNQLSLAAKRSQLQLCALVERTSLPHENVSKKTSFTVPALSPEIQVCL